MSAQPPRTTAAARSTRRVVLDIVLLIGVPSVLIYLISLVWK
jgi:hypothetical protein